MQVSKTIKCGSPYFWYFGINMIYKISGIIMIYKIYMIYMIYMIYKMSGNNMS